MAKAKGNMSTRLYLLHAFIEKLQRCVPLINKGAVFDKLREHLSLHHLRVEFLVSPVLRLLEP